MTEKIDAPYKAEKLHQEVDRSARESEWKCWLESFLVEMVDIMIMVWSTLPNHSAEFGQDQAWDDFREKLKISRHNTFDARCSRFCLSIVDCLSLVCSLIFASTSSLFALTSSIFALNLSFIRNDFVKSTLHSSGF